MYTKGDLRIVTPPCKSADEYGDCYLEGHVHSLLSNDTFPQVLPYAYLPHSCDEWIIGGQAEVKLLIEDLQEWLHLQGKTIPIVQNA